MWYMYKYVLKHPFRQDGHDRLKIMDQQLPYFQTDNLSRYLIVGHICRSDRKSTKEQDDTFTSTLDNFEFEALDKCNDSFSFFFLVNSPVRPLGPLPLQKNFLLFIYVLKNPETDFYKKNFATIFRLNQPYFWANI